MESQLTGREPAARAEEDDAAGEVRPPAAGGASSRLAGAVPLLILAGGAAARLALARTFFLNADEALHQMLASQPTVGLAYRASLTTAHPPLLILLLHFWRSLGQSELVLRLPSVLAGTASAWLIYQWMKRVAGRSAALLTLLLLSFAPALIELSTEVRQYALLWLFMAGCLYLSERALREDSPRLMILCSLSLLGALLTHYSALIFALTLGVTLLVRLWPERRSRRRVLAVWIGGQLVALALVGTLLVTHVAGLRRSGMAQEIADTWLRNSIYHPGDTHPVAFVAAQTVRVFIYFFAHGVVGTLALLAFLAGISALLRRGLTAQRERRRQRVALALLLGLPFIVTCGCALLGLYPYGETRHSAVLALFGLSGAGLGLAALWPAGERAKRLLAVLIVGCLLLCNLFPSPPPSIRPGDHGRALMGEAMASLRRSAPPGAILLSDYQSGLLLGYYACGHGIVQLWPPQRPLAESGCGPYAAVTTDPGEWSLPAREVTGELAGAARTYSLAPGTKVWWFDAGWIGSFGSRSPADLEHYGCLAPRFFGRNIFLCQLTVGGPRFRAPD